MFKELHKKYCLKYWVPVKLPGKICFILLGSYGYLTNYFSNYWGLKVAGKTVFQNNRDWKVPGKIRGYYCSFQEQPLYF